MNQTSNKLDFKTWSQCDPFTQYLSADKGKIVVNDGSAYEAFGWEYNSVLKNPFGCCATLPKREELFERNKDLTNLFRAFTQCLSRINPKKLSETKMEKLDKVMHCLMIQLNNSKLGYKITDIFKGDDVQDFHQELGKLSSNANRFYSTFKKWVMEAFQIERELKKLIPENEQSISDIVNKFLNNKMSRLSTHNLIDVLEKYKDDNNVELNSFLEELQEKTRSMAKATEWNLMRAPTDPSVSVDQNDFFSIRVFLNDCFPDYQNYHQYYFLNKEVLLNSIPKLDESSLLAVCDDLIKTSVRIMDRTIEDLKQWGDNDPQKMAAILGTQRHFRSEFCHQHYSGEGTYINKTFFNLFEAYRLVASLSSPIIDFGRKEFMTPNAELAQSLEWRKQFFIEGTLPFEWRKIYNEKIEEIRDLIGVDNLKLADDRLLHQLHEDKDEEKPLAVHANRPT